MPSTNATVTIEVDHTSNSDDEFPKLEVGTSFPLFG